MEARIGGNTPYTAVSLNAVFYAICSDASLPCNGRKIDVSAVQYQLGELTPDSAFPRISTRKPPKDRIQIYRAERALLNAVRDGDLDGAAAMANAADVARVRQYTDNPLRNAQIACTTFAAVCTRAAIEGGLSTTMSYCLGDAYIKVFCREIPFRGG